MSQPYIGEIRMFGFGFRGAPNGWQVCDGSLLPISEYDALFALIGTTYGGDGQTTFAVPDLRGRLPIHQGQGPGLSNRIIGEMGGTETVTLTTTQLPAHTHVWQASPRAATTPNPVNAVLAMDTIDPVYSASVGTVDMHPTAVSAVGGNQSHDNMMPTLTVTFGIAVYGIFPSQA